RRSTSGRCTTPAWSRSWAIRTVTGCSRAGAATRSGVPTCWATPRTTSPPIRTPTRPSEPCPASREGAQPVTDTFGDMSVLFIAGTGVRDLVRGGRLASGGMQARGVVLDTYVRTYAHEDSRRPHRVETIGFTTSTGQRVRSTPAVADIGMVDRSGEEVAVFYDHDRPDRFIAPKNGRRLSPAK